MSRRTFVFAAVVSLCLTSALAAATRTWTGAVSANWSDSGNWSPSGTPVSGDSLIFPLAVANITNDLPAGTVVGPMTFNGNYTLNGNALTLGGDVMFQGAFFTCNAPIKLGTSVHFLGALTLGTYAGGFDMNGQALTIESSTTWFSGPVNGSGTITAVNLPLDFLGGGTFSGTINAPVNMASALPNGDINASSTMVTGFGTAGNVNAQTMQPGDTRGGPVIGTLNTKSVTIGSSYVVEVTGSGTSDSVHAIGSVTVAGNLTLNVNSGVPTPGQSFTIIDNDGSDPIVGTFTGLPEGGHLTAGGVAFRISYAGGSGNDVVLTVEASGTKTWSGAVSGNWSNPANWLPQAIPVDGEELLFPNTASNLTMTNDLPAGSTRGKMTINSNYTLNGNALTLGGDVTFQAAFFTCNAPVKLGTSVHFLGALTLGTYAGGFDMNGQALTIESSTTWFSGPVNGSGTITAVNLPLDFLGGGTFSGTINAPVNLACALPNGDINASSTMVTGFGTAGNVNAQTMQPGDTRGGPVIGTLNTKSVTVGSSYVVEVTGSGTSDLVHTIGSVTVAGNLTVGVLSGVPTPGQSFTIIDNDGSDPVVGTFTGLPEGSKVTGGGYSFRISYAGGDGNDVVLTVAVDTSTSIGQNAATAVIGEPVTFTATVTSANGTPAGVVSFADGGTGIGSAPLINGAAQLTVSTLGAGTHSIVATYGGSGPYLSSASAPLSHVVQKGHTTVSLDVDNTTSVWGTTLLFTAQVNVVAPAVGTLSGTITLRSDGVIVGTGTVASNGKSIVNVGNLPAGVHAVTASYGGTSDFEASDSNAIQMTVTKAPTTISATAEQNPVPAGSPITLDVNLNGVSGLIIVSEGSKQLAQAGVAATPLKITFTGLESGSHELTIAYTGSDNFLPSSTSLTLAVSTSAVYADDVASAEGNSGTTAVSMTLHLSTPSLQSVRVNWKTGDGTALSGEDYESASGVVEFAPGETSKQIALRIVGDTKPEEDESFSVVLSSPVNATMARSSAGVFITNDDATSKSIGALAYSNGLTLDLYVPVTTAPPYPVIVWVPGFTSYDSDATVVPALHETLRGYAVAVVRYRDPATAHFPAQLDDLKSAIRWLRANASQWGLDSQHIAAWGNGAGAHLAALLGSAGDTTPPADNAAFSSAVQAVVDWNGASDLASLNTDGASCNVIDHDAASSPESQLLGCPLQTCGARASAASPLMFARGGLAPFLMMHAGDDCYIAPAQSQKLFAALSHAGVDATLHVYNGVSHVDPFWRSQAALGVVEAFLDAKLKQRPTRGRSVRH